MSHPPDIVSANMTPNPGDGDQRRSRHEEVRAQRAIVHLVNTLAREAGLTVTQDPGCIDPAATPNPERSASIKAETNPKLVEFTRRVGASIEVGKIRTADGDVIENFKIRKGAETKLAVNLKDLQSLLSGMIGESRDAVIAIVVKIGALMGVRVREADEADADFNTATEFDAGDDDFDDDYPPNKEDRD